MEDNGPFYRNWNPLAILQKSSVHTTLPRGRGVIIITGGVEQVKGLCVPRQPTIGPLRRGRIRSRPSCPPKCSVLPITLGLTRTCCAAFIVLFLRHEWDKKSVDEHASRAGWRGRSGPPGPSQGWVFTFFPGGHPGGRTGKVPIRPADGLLASAGNGPGRSRVLASVPPPMVHGATSASDEGSTSAP